MEKSSELGLYCISQGSVVVSLLPQETVSPVRVRWSLCGGSFYPQKLAEGLAPHVHSTKSWWRWKEVFLRHIMKSQLEEGLWLSEKPATEAKFWNESGCLVIWYWLKSKPSREPSHFTGEETGGAEACGRIPLVMSQWGGVSDSGPSLLTLGDFLSDVDMMVTSEACGSEPLS